VVSASLTQWTVVPVESIPIRFTKPINTSTFSVADDVLSLASPSGANLKGAIGGVVWSGGNTILALSLPAQSRFGQYTVLLGPAINASDTGLAIDQNLDGVGGTINDNVTVVVNYSPYIGPDASGYSAGASFFENLDLVAGGPGVVDTGLSVGDGSTSLNFGANTFNFYGTSYSGAQALVNSNGLITFGSGTTAYINTDLATSPSQAAIVLRWDDWRTDVNTADRVLYRLDEQTGDGVADRMVIEWSDMVNYGNPASPATFQAILELNKASRAGTITFNYLDLIVGAPAGDGGASAAVGIKAAGTSGGNRVLASLDRPGNPWVGSGRAMRFGLDVVPSQIPSATAPAKRLPRVKLRMSEVSGLPAPADFSVINCA